MTDEPYRPTPKAAPSPRTRWQRFVDWALKRDHIVTLHTEAEIYEFARSYLEPRGEWLLEVGVQARRESGRPVWYVCTNVPQRGGNSQLTIDDETLEIVRHVVVGTVPATVRGPNPP